MRRALLAVTTALATAALAVTGMAAAASPSYSLGGLVASSGQFGATFFGAGNGSAGDKLLLNVAIEHTGLPTDPEVPADVTGGTLSGKSLGRGGVGALEGTFIGGIVTLNAALSSRAACGDRVFDVLGNLAMQSGTGTLRVQITEKRRALPGGRCLSFPASAEGAPGLTLAEAAEF